MIETDKNDLSTNVATSIHSEYKPLEKIRFPKEEEEKGREFRHMYRELNW